MEGGPPVHWHPGGERRGLQVQAPDHAQLQVSWVYSHICFHYVILFILSYISGESNPYRGYQVLIQTAGGSDFIITITEREIQR